MLVAAALAASALAACGGGADLLAGETAEEIKENLDLVERSVEEGDCTGAEEATSEVKQQVEDLQVDSELKAALEEGVDLLSEKVLAECGEGEEEETTDLPETTEEEVEPEEDEREQKPGKEKQQPEEPETEEREEQPEDEEKEETTEPPPTETEEPSSGGVGPSAPAGGE